MEFIKTDVMFDEVNHKYYLSDGITEISGITRRLGKSIFFRDKFKGIPEHILQNAAAKGTMVHNQLDQYVKGLPYMPIPEVESFQKLKQKELFQCLDSEFLISDMRQYATMIDLITAESDGSLALNDHKTTYKLDKEYLSWQLSICRYLFENQTGVRIEKLFAIHFKDGKVKRVEVGHKTDEEVINMLYTDKYMQNEMPTETSEVLSIPKKDIATLEKLENKIVAMSEQIKQLEMEKSVFLNGIGKQMEEHGVDKVQFGRIAITLTKPYERESIDAAKLYEAYPDLEGKFTKKAYVKGSVKLKISKDD